MSESDVSKYHSNRFKDKTIPSGEELLTTTDAITSGDVSDELTASLLGNASRSTSLDDAEDARKDLYANTPWMTRWTSYIAFLFFGIFTTIPWYAMTTSVGVFIHVFGNNIFLLFMISHNLPALPFLVLQLLYDEKCNAQFGLRLVYWVRFSFVVFLTLLCLVGLIAMQYFDAVSRVVILSISIILGVQQVISFGFFTQLAGIFPPKSVVFYFVGNSVSSLILFVTNLAINWGPDPSFLHFAIYFGIPIVFVILSYGAFGVLSSTNLGNSAYKIHDNLLANANIQVASDPSPEKQGWRMYLEVFQMIWKSALSCFTIWFGYMLVWSYLSWIPTQDEKDPFRKMQFYQYLVYCNMFCSFIGKQLASITLPFEFTDGLLLFLGNFLNIIGIIPFHFYVAKLIPYQNDIGFAVLFSIFFLISGYLSSMSYVICGQTKGLSQRHLQLAFAIMNFFLYLGIVLGAVMVYLTRLVGFSIANEVG